MPESESSRERLDRNLEQLMTELRVAMPGVQVLFAFLLTVPFSQRYEKLDLTERRVLFGAILSAALSSLLLIAPAANHRLLFREGIKEHLLRAANRLVIAGLIMLALGIGLSLYLVTVLVFSTAVAVVVSIVVASVTVFTWFVFPRLLELDQPDE